MKRALVKCCGDVPRHISTYILRFDRGLITNIYKRWSAKRSTTILSAQKLSYESSPFYLAERKRATVKCLGGEKIKKVPKFYLIFEMVICSNQNEKDSVARHFLEVIVGNQSKLQ